MGMYDEIRCKAPLPGNAATFVTPDHWFQTKDLECALGNYEITEDGKLIHVSRMLDQQAVDSTISHHGDINFYTANWRAFADGVTYTQNGEDFEHVEYCARFTNGVLQ